MAAKKSSSAIAGGILALLGSLVYLYVVFTWYNGGGAASAWLTAAQFFAPFVVGLAIVSTISIFFMSIGGMTGKMKSDKMMNAVYWKLIMAAGVTLIILTGGTMWFWWVIVGFILTYLGAAWETMM
jgi:uncharacterized membrane protein